MVLVIRGEARQFDVEGVFAGWKRDKPKLPSFIGDGRCPAPNQRRRTEPNRRVRQDPAGFVFDSAQECSGEHLGMGQPGDEHQSEHDGLAEAALCSHRSLSLTEFSLPESSVL